MNKERRDEYEHKKIIAMIRDLNARGIDTTVVENAHYIVLDE